MSVTRISRALDPHEVQYLEAVSGHLGDLPADLHIELLNEAAEHLAERPRSRDLGELLGPLGPPELYAETLRADHEAEPAAIADVVVASVSQASTLRRWWLAVLAVVVVVGSAGGCGRGL